MKKIFAFLLSCLLCLVMVMPVSAAFKNPAVADGAGYLTSEEHEIITEKLNRIREVYDFDAAIYTEEEMSGYDAESTADDIFDYGGYGNTENADGMLLYICADTREYHFTTHGYGLTAFNSNGLAYLEKEILPYLQENDYYTAFSVYADLAAELLEMAQTGEPFNEKQRSKPLIAVILGATVLAPVTIASSKTKSKLRKMKTAEMQEYAADYVKPGSMDIKVSRDVFLYSSVTKTEKAKSDSDTHKSSSGRTHGGRGGSF